MPYDFGLLASDKTNLHKLPKWAQQLINRLDGQVSSLLATVEDANREATDAEFTHGVYEGPLEHKFAASCVISANIMVSTDGDRLTLMGLNGRGLVILPEVTNVINVAASHDG